MSLKYLLNWTVRKDFRNITFIPISVFSHSIWRKSLAYTKSLASMVRNGRRELDRHPPFLSLPSTQTAYNEVGDIYRIRLNCFSLYNKITECTLAYKRYISEIPSKCTILWVYKQDMYLTMNKNINDSWVVYRSYKQYKVVQYTGSLHLWIKLVINLEV